jgi:hypothetical protein
MKRVHPASRWLLTTAIVLFAACAATTAFAAPNRSSAIHTDTPAGDGWVQLGSSHVDGSRDHDTIEVGASKGAFRALRFQVQGTPVKFDQVVIHLEGGQSKTVSSHFVLADHAAGREIGLPKKSPGIESVELWYERTNAGSRPEVILLGRPSAMTITKATVSPGVARKDALCPVQQFCSLYRELLVEANPKRLAEMALILNGLFHGLLQAGIAPGLPYRELLMLLSQLADQALRQAHPETSVSKPASSSAAKPVAPARMLFQLALQHGSQMVAINVYLETPLTGLGALLDFLQSAHAGK